MAPTGRPPKPIEVKRRTGNPGKRPLPARATTALVPAEGIPPVPIKLKKPGRTTWAMVWDGARSWLSLKLDGIRVETVCRLVDEIAELEATITKLGWLLSEPIVTPAGAVVGEKVVPNPAVRMLRDAEKQLDRELSALGFDPTSRSRLGLAEVKKQSILESLLAASTSRSPEGQVIEAEVIDIAPDR